MILSRRSGGKRKAGTGRGAVEGMGEKRRQNYKKENDSAPSHAAAAASATSADRATSVAAVVVGVAIARASTSAHAQMQHAIAFFKTSLCILQVDVQRKGMWFCCAHFSLHTFVCLHIGNPHNECILSFLRMCNFCCCSIIMWQSFRQPYLHLSGMRRDGVVVVRMLCRKNAGSVLPPRFRPNSRGT